MDRREWIRDALARSREVQAMHPGLPFLESIDIQLRYLIDLLDGLRQDRERLKDVIVGVLAAREIETLDPEYARLLHEVAGEVEKMRFGL